MGRNGEASRRGVLDAVARIVAERGLEGIRIREIAAEAHVSPATVLYHFPDQSELILAVHADLVDRYITGRRAALDPQQPASANLLSVMRAGVPPWANEHMIRVLFEMHGLAWRSPRHADLLSDLWLAEKSIYVDIIADGVRDGTFSPSGDPERIAAQLLALEDGLVLHEMSRNQNVDPQTVVSDFAGAAASLLGLASDPGLTRAEGTQTGA